MNHIPVKESCKYMTRGRLFAKTPVVDIQELFRYDPIGLEKYQERVRGIEARFDKIIRRKK